jgi:hypothetical protein
MLCGQTMLPSPAPSPWAAAIQAGDKVVEEIVRDALRVVKEFQSFLSARYRRGL